MGGGAKKEELKKTDHSQLPGKGALKGEKHAMHPSERAVLEKKMGSGFMEMQERKMGEMKAKAEQRAQPKALDKWEEQIEEHSRKGKRKHAKHSDSSDSDSDDNHRHKKDKKSKKDKKDKKKDKKSKKDSKDPTELVSPSGKSDLWALMQES